MPSNHLILCCPLLLLPSIFPSIRVFWNESAVRIRWPMYWSFRFNISPSNEHPGLISFRMDWLDLLAVQRTLKSLLQHHSSKASILLCSAFFIVQLSHPYMTTGKTIALARQTFVVKVMSLLFNMLFRLVITFLPRSKRTKDIKGYDSTIQSRDTWDNLLNKGIFLSSWSLKFSLVTCGSILVPHTGSSLNTFLWDFYRGFITWEWLIKSQAIGGWLSFSSSPLPIEIKRWDRMFQPSIQSWFPPPSLGSF